MGSGGSGRVPQLTRLVRSACGLKRADGEARSDERARSERVEEARSVLTGRVVREELERCIECESYGCEARSDSMR